MHILLRAVKKAWKILSDTDQSTRTTSLLQLVAVPGEQGLIINWGTVMTWCPCAFPWTQVLSQSDSVLWCIGHTAMAQTELRCLSVWRVERSRGVNWFLAGLHTDSPVTRVRDDLWYYEAESKELWEEFKEIKTTKYSEDNSKIRESQRKQNCVHERKIFLFGNLTKGFLERGRKNYFKPNPIFL